MLPAWRQSSVKVSQDTQHTARRGFITRFYKHAAAACVLESFVIDQKLPYGIIYLFQKGNSVPQPTQPTQIITCNMLVMTTNQHMGAKEKEKHKQ